MSHHDVVVIGTGLAGLTAAVRLAESGARVLVLAKGIGATHLSPCTIDVLGYAPDRVERPGEALGAFVEANPGHPYARVGADGVAAAVDWFKRRFAAGSLAPYAYTGDLGENLLLPTAVGAARPSAVVPETMAAGDLRRDDPVCVVGFRALQGLPPVAARRHAGRSAPGSGAVRGARPDPGAPPRRRTRWALRARSTTRRSADRSSGSSRRA